MAYSDAAAIADKLTGGEKGDDKEEKGKGKGKLSSALMMKSEDIMACMNHGPDGPPKASKLGEALLGFMKQALREMEMDGE